MECLRCGKEIRGDSQFCIYCGQKVSQCGYDQETQKLAEKLADLEKEQAELEKKKQETLQEEQDLNLKLDNYTRLQKGEYARCRKWRSEPATAREVQQRETEKTAKRTNSKIFSGSLYDVLWFFAAALGECAIACMDHGLCRGRLSFKLF